MKNQIIIIFLYLFSILATSSSIKTRQFLSKGSSFSVKDASFSSPLLTSPDQNFSCGFSTVGSNAYWLSIWFTKSTDRTIVWMANRDNPVNGHRSSISFTKNGAFVLTDFDGSTVWETNTSSTSVDRVELRDSGNLVLTNRSGTILWESFDFPTDTLLPGQLFTKTSTLVSNLGVGRFGKGYFSFLFDINNVLTMIYNGPEMSSIYWPDVTAPNVFANGRTNYNSSRIASFDDRGVFVSSDHFHFSALDVGVGVKRRLTIDSDGNLRLYSLNETSGLWIVSFQALVNPCDVHGICGRNGICVHTPDPKCTCPPNYEQFNSTDWSQGCKPMFERSCSDSQFVEMPHTDYYGFNLNYIPVSSFEDCQKSCLQDCHCQGFGYRLTGEATCYTKSALFNGYRSISFPGIMHIRVPTGEKVTPTLNMTPSNLDCSNLATYDLTNQRFKWVYMYSFVLAMGVIEVIIALCRWWFLFRKNGIPASMEDGYRTLSSQFRSFSYCELKIATNKFKDVLGSGGFGVVYKGVLTDKRPVAVKKLGNIQQGEEEFWAEVSMIARINHMNLLRIWGFCAEGKNRVLVYELIENGSLDKHLFSDHNSLGWKERFKVAIGTAKGLAYLHHECLDWVIHCDVKPENILIDKDFEPKISDFGLAKLRQRSGNGISELTNIRGTKGYMAPEWTTNLPLSSKVDVYSFGVVILELVKGIRLSKWVSDESSPSESELMKVVRTAKAMIEMGGDCSWVDNLVDPNLGGEFNRKEALAMIKVGICCVDDDRNKRPTMESVTQILTECEEIQH